MRNDDLLGAEAFRLVTLASIVLFTSGAEPSPCRGIISCQKCLTSLPSCAWCLRTDEEGPNAYCEDWAVVKSQCSEYLYPNGSYQAPKDEDFAERTEEREAVQMKPQTVFLELRPKQPVRLSVEYKQAKNVPVDLYYLMDLSNSMKDDKDKLSSLGDSVAEKMKNITRDFRIGFGSFVEKVTFPFVNTLAFEKNKQYENFSRPYCFRNHMSLSADTGRFKKEVNAANTSANVDDPEAGLDALLQAIVCKEEIGWRDNSRKILVFSTDNKYHIAGDGKLAGILRPNSGRCSLNREGEYSECTDRDYPSVAQIVRVARERRVNVIFAVTRQVVDAYRSLASRMEGSTVALLSHDSSNIVQLIQEQYNAITSTVKLTSNASDLVNFTFFSSCPGGGDKCENVPPGTVVSFEMEVTLDSCPPDRNLWNQTFLVSPVGVDEALIVDLTMMCECQCQTPENREEESVLCSGEGTLECGSCLCPPGRAGKRCECDAKDGSYRNDSACIGHNNVICSGRGICVCGQCMCETRYDPNERIFGHFCECDNFSCNRYKNAICAGHGICQCGVCECFPGWTGDSCQCEDSVNACFDPVTEKICNDRGVCECGSCRCVRNDEEYYYGTWCQMCSVCPENCGLYDNCVGCKTFYSGPLTLQECDNCTGFYRHLRANDSVEGMQKCTFVDDDDCRVHFYYRLDEKDTPVIIVNPVKDCPGTVDYFPVVSGLVGGILGTGLAALLAWKLITHVHDTREFARFTREWTMQSGTRTKILCS
ncbi:integrin beta-PS-like [Centruroides vittatus]|uniref:integrin beta-PS-like n=1 Tax=Centruroides vittatus TaxID=120091 RepID=UPI003510D1A9